MRKVKVATVWLDGCSGCHMSLLDMDAAIIALGRKIDIVYGPLVDAQEFPEDVDVTLVEGAVSSQDDLNKIQKIRQRTGLLISLGDCAVTGNVPALRNSIPVQKLLQRIYVEGAEEGKVVPMDRVPPLLPQARPLVAPRSSYRSASRSGGRRIRLSASVARQRLLPVALHAPPSAQRFRGQCS